MIVVVVRGVSPVPIPFLFVVIQLAVIPVLTVVISLAIPAPIVGVLIRPGVIVVIVRIVGPVVGRSTASGCYHWNRKCSHQQN